MYGLSLNSVWHEHQPWSLVVAHKDTEPALSDVIGKNKGSTGHCGLRTICVLVQVVVSLKCAHGTHLMPAGAQFPLA